jgi:hypothetical protein
MHLGYLPVIAYTVLLCACASRKDASPTPSAAGLSKTATPTERLKHFFPLGVDWSNASPDQISAAVLTAVKSDPENATDIATAAMDGVRQSGRFPKIDSADAKTFVDPEPKRTLLNVLFPKKRSP